MSSFSYEIEYAKAHGVVHAIIVSYCNILQIKQDEIDVDKLCAVTGLTKIDVCKDLKIDVSQGVPDNPVVPKVQPPKVNLFGNKKIINTNKPSPTNYADAICKSLPSLVSDSGLISALDKWVRVIYKSGKGITKEQVMLAIQELEDLAKGNIPLAIDIVNTATQAGYKVFKWCMPTVMKRNQISTLIHNKDFTPRVSNNIDIIDEGF